MSAPAAPRCECLRARAPEVVHELEHRRVVDRDVSTSTVVMAARPPEQRADVAHLRTRSNALRDGGRAARRRDQRGRTSTIGETCGEKPPSRSLRHLRAGAQGPRRRAGKLLPRNPQCSLPAGHLRSSHSVRRPAWRPGTGHPPSARAGSARARLLACSALCTAATTTARTCCCGTCVRQPGRSLTQCRLSELSAQSSTPAPNGGHSRPRPRLPSAMLRRQRSLAAARHDHAPGEVALESSRTTERSTWRARKPFPQPMSAATPYVRRVEQPVREARGHLVAEVVELRRVWAAHRCTLRCRRFRRRSKVACVSRAVFDARQRPSSRRHGPGAPAFSVPISHRAQPDCGGMVRASSSPTPPPSFVRRRGRPLPAPCSGDSPVAPVRGWPRRVSARGSS